jgi:uncharacterized protein (UPF0332 family)
LALHDDLLRQARSLAYHEPKKPKQASLRRAVSTAYYALFHLLTSDAADRLVTGAGKEELRAVLRRAFEHTIMFQACREVTKQGAGKLEKAMGGATVPLALMDVAQAFIVLQQARHEADYDISLSFTRLEVLDMVALSEKAFVNWRAVRKTIPADVFVTALLANRGMCR